MRTPITYYGGKQTMLKHIMPLLPKHDIYVESFAGGAALFFAKQPSKMDVINDLNGELINFYRTIVSSYDELKAEIERTLPTKRHGLSTIIRTILPMCSAHGLYGYSRKWGLPDNYRTLSDSINQNVDTRVRFHLPKMRLR